MLYNEQDRSRFFNRITKSIIDTMENELKDLLLFKERKMHNIEDRLYYIKNLKKKLKIE